MAQDLMVCEGKQDDVKYVQWNLPVLIIDSAFFAQIFQQTDSIFLIKNRFFVKECHAVRVRMQLGKGNAKHQGIHGHSNKQIQEQLVSFRHNHAPSVSWKQLVWQRIFMQ